MISDPLKPRLRYSRFVSFKPFLCYIKKDIISGMCNLRQACSQPCPNRESNDDIYYRKGRYTV